MKKICIMYATAGIGHKKAAIAVKKAFDELNPADCAVTLIDALDYTTDFFKRSYLGTYLFAINKLPAVWGLSYHLTDNKLLNRIVRPIRRLNNAAYSANLLAFLQENDFDVIVSTHFFGSEVVADLKRQGKLRAKLITVVTDYRLHAWWVNEPTDTYVVASEDTKADLLEWKVDPAKVRPLGIPIEPVFTRSHNAPAIREKLGFREGVCTVLVIGGGFGVGPIEDIVQTVNALGQPVQLIVVCGHNEELAKRLSSLTVTPQVTMKVFGFVDNVYEYMEVADILISKSGGITVSESLAKEVPMLIIAPIIGQETRNSAFLVKHKAAVEIPSLAELKGLLEDLVTHPEKRTALRDAIRTIRKPESCYDVARLAEEMAS